MMNSKPQPGTSEFVDRVCESNDHALENGYDLLSWAPEEIAVDLADYDADFEGIDTDLLIEPVREWFRRHGATPPEPDGRIVQGHDH